MQPLSDFVDHYVNTSWRPREEYIVQNSELHRFRIIVEHADTKDLNQGMIGMWRHDKLAEEGIDATCSDAKEFADQLINSLFYHLSPHETMHVIAALEKYIDEWHDERVAVIKANPKIFGDLLPDEKDKRCSN